MPRWELPTTGTSIVYKNGKVIFYLGLWSIYSQIVSNNLIMWLNFFNFRHNFRSTSIMMNGKLEIHHCIRQYGMKSSMIVIMIYSILGLILCILMT